MTGGRGAYMRWLKMSVVAALASVVAVPALEAQEAPAAMERVADRQPGEGAGPFRRLVAG